MNESKKVAIIIVTWKGMQWIKGCLDSIRCSNFPVTVLLLIITVLMKLLVLLNKIILKLS